MILLDTHIWVWWVQGDKHLPKIYADFLSEKESDGMGVSIISCWEVAKLVEVGRITFPVSTLDWITTALQYPGMQLVELTPRIVVESTQLPGEFHRDPADQMIVATARILKIPLLTIDTKILSYPHVEHARKV